MKTTIALLLLAGAPAWALAGEGPHPRVLRFETRIPPGAPLPHGPEHDMMFLRAHEGVELRTVKGAPYTAEGVSESVQVLADGNRIVHRTTSLMARDGEGRTRREQEAGFGLPGFGSSGARTAFVNDPVAGTRFVLDLEARTAHKLGMPPMEFERRLLKDADGKPMELEFERNIVVRVPPPPPAPDAPAPPAPPEAPEAPDAPPAPGPVVRQFHMRLPAPAGFDPADDAKAEKLGTRTIEGVEAEGTRSVTVIPAGQIGNERPIEIVSERWYAPQLQAVVQSRHVDPRFGETTWKLTNIVLGEPDRSLFDVPSDFKVKDTPGPGVIRMRRH